MKIGGVMAGVLAVVLASRPASAAETIRPGRWQFTVELRMPGLPAPPGAGGVTVTRTACLAAGDAGAALPQPPVPSPAAPPTAHSGQPQCRLDRLDRSGGIVSWASTCRTAEATIHSEGTAHYESERIEARYTSRTSVPGRPPIEASQHVSGRYLGPCDSR